MTKHDLPDPACPHGYTEDQLIEIFGAVGVEGFKTWMRGQTFAQCEGIEYNHTKREHAESACYGNPHGNVYYASDVRRYAYKCHLVS